MHLAPGRPANDVRTYHRQCLALLKAGYRVELAAQTLPGAQLDPRITVYSLGDYGQPTLGWRVLRRARRSLRAYRLARRSQAALYQYDSPEFILWGARLRRASGRPVVFDCMEDFEGYARQRRGVPEWIRPALVRLVQRQLRIAARSCDAILVADEGTARLLRPHARRVVVLHNFPQLALFPDLPLTATSDQPYDIVYHGSIPRYHLEVCLAVDAALVQRGYHVRWRFIGWLPETAWLEAELSRRGIRDRFCISGAMPHTQIPGEVRKAKLGIIPLPDLPKFQHNIPQKLFEFMALRMPVVLSDLPPSRVFVPDGACAFLVPPDDYAAYADAIIRLLADPALRRRMGAEGRRRVEEEFNWERESQKLIGLYSEVLGG